MKRHVAATMACGLALALAAILLVGCAPKPQPPSLTPTPKPTLTKKFKVCISTRPGQWNLDERRRGYVETFAKYYPEIEVVQTIDDETKYETGESRGGAVLNSYPDLAAFCGLNAASGPGVAQAVKNAGKVGQVTIVAMDADSAILDLIQEGVITASVAQRQYKMSYLGVKYLFGLNHGIYRVAGDKSKPNLPEIPAVLDTGTVEVNKQNVDKFRTPSQGAAEEMTPEQKTLPGGVRPKPDPDEQYVVIGISTGVEYWNACRAGLEDACVYFGLDPQKSEFTGPPDQNPEKQADMMSAIIGRKPSGILIAPGRAETLAPYIDKAIEKGIPTLTIDTDSPDSKRYSYIGTSNYDAGVTGAHILARALGATKVEATAPTPSAAKGPE